MGTITSADLGSFTSVTTIEAPGSPGLIMDMRRGRMPSVERLQALCEVLGLEFDVGRPRTVRGADLDVERLILALEALTDGFPDAEKSLPTHDRAQLLVAVYALLGEPDAAVGAVRARELLALARRFGVTDAVRE